MIYYRSWNCILWYRGRLNRLGIIYRRSQICIDAVGRTSRQRNATKVRYIRFIILIRKYYFANIFFSCNFENIGYFNLDTFTTGSDEPRGLNDIIVLYILRARVAVANILSSIIGFDYYLCC